MKECITIGMAGAGRATELHMEAYNRVRGIPLRFKTIIAKTEESAQKGKLRYHFEKVGRDFDEMIDDKEIDVIDICTPPYVHDEMIIKALEAGKYVICEKPLTGYFGLESDIRPIGINVDKKEMYERLMKSMKQIQKVVEKYPGHFMYAENFVYAPTMQKAAEIIEKKKSRILCAKGEESLKGSSSKVAGCWDKTGGGTFIRTGTHPLSAILWLKQIEAKSRGENIEIESVVSDMGNITLHLNEYDHRHIAAQPIDVEDFGTTIMTFSDHTKAIIMATDTLLGGSRNYVELYCNDAVINCNLTLTNNMDTYFLDEDRLEDVYISEMLPSKLGWNHPFIEDDVMRGYMAEIQDFMECIQFGRHPRSDFKLAYDTMKVVYASYMSSDEGKRICMREQMDSQN